MAEELRQGLVGEATLTVEPEHAASRYGAAGVEVFATPVLVALMERACIDALEGALPPGSATVGAGFRFQHTAATPLGATVRARAELTQVDGRRLVFQVEAFDPWEKIGGGELERFVVQLDRFLSRVQEKAARPPQGGG
ncbi:MAG TPA: thioesterase family protein [Dehalococcoidia bacterium]|jgi:fluoroacetyl-CoA thioesterase|nr:thioesterase family protein [Dehalococcoidia bacterium]